jgi:hypothetical protein
MQMKRPVLPIGAGCPCGSVQLISLLCCCSYLPAISRNATADRIAHGFRIDAPVVARLSKSIWAFDASFNA